MKIGASTLLTVTLLLALCGCAANDSKHVHHGTAATASPPTITPVDGAMAVFRAKVGPILCEYARNLQSSEQATTRAAENAGGAINASAPENAQTEYAAALGSLSSMLRATVYKFRAVSPPAQIAVEYRGFIDSLRSVAVAAARAASYAAARNYAEIAAMENIATPSTGEGVFQKAGISSC
jgi:hypothetical protein